MQHIQVGRGYLGVPLLDVVALTAQLLHLENHWPKELTAHVERKREERTKLTQPQE